MPTKVVDEPDVRVLGVTKCYNLRNNGRDLLLHFYTLKPTRHPQMTIWRGCEIFTSVLVDRAQPRIPEPRKSYMPCALIKKGGQGGGQIFKLYKLGIRLYQNGFLSALVEVTGSVVASIEPNRVGHIEMAHQFGNISQAGL